MDNLLTDKVVIITGASSGIGAVAARTLAGLGCKVTLAARSADKLHALAKELGDCALAVPTDVTVGQAVVNMVEQTIAHFGRVDILLANAGIYIPGKVPEGDPEDWAKMLDINVDGVLRCVHAVLPHMIAQASGDILVTSSISGHVDIEWEPVYSASKHAIQAFVHTLRRQVAPYRIRVGSIAPGTVANEIWHLTDPVEINRRVDERTVLRNEDVVQAMVFMLSQPPNVTIRDLVILPQNQDI